MKVYISTIAKNEFQYIKEYVTHHIALGFDKNKMTVEKTKWLID